MRFTIKLEKSEEGGYIAKCLEIPAAISEGNTKEEALENIRSYSACPGSYQRTGPGTW